VRDGRERAWDGGGGAGREVRPAHAADSCGLELSTLGPATPCPEYPCTNAVITLIQKLLQQGNRNSLVSRGLERAVVPLSLQAPGRCGEDEFADLCVPPEKTRGQDPAIMQSRHEPSKPLLNGAHVDLHNFVGAVAHHQPAEAHGAHAFALNATSLSAIAKQESGDGTFAHCAGSN
jgi:hypothetical protein